MNAFEQFRDNVNAHPGWFNFIVIAVWLSFWWYVAAFLFVTTWIEYGWKQAVLEFREDVLDQPRETLWDYWESKQQGKQV